MARRKSSFIEDVFELAARLPWWWGVIGAVVTLVIFHSFASTEPPKIDGLQGVGSALGKQFVRTISMLLQWVIPIALLAGSAASAITRIKRKSLFTAVATSTTHNAVQSLTWVDFERLVGEAFRLHGFEVDETGQASGDGGVDLVLRRGGELYLVQCKHWRATKVGVQTVRELYGVMAAFGATGGYVVTSGRFTTDAVKFAAGRNIELVDGAALNRMIESARHSLSGKQNAMRNAWTVNQPPQVLCPQCNEPMVKRVAKRGSNAGLDFWGCSSYPRCRGIRPMS